MGLRVEPRVSLVCVCVGGGGLRGAGNSVVGGEHSMGASLRVVTMNPVLDRAERPGSTAM